MPHPHKNREILNSNANRARKDDNGITEVSREQVYPMVSNSYRKSANTESNQI
jgi:hypothetical protein